MTSLIRFLHISDTHFGPDTQFIYQNKNPYQDGLYLIAEIKKLPVTVDFIIHTGDVVSFQNDEAYKIAKEVLSQIHPPLYFVTGNHDDPVRLNSFPLFAQRTPLVKRSNSVSYFFEFQDTLFITIDAKHPDDNNPSGIIPEDVLLAVKKIIDESKKPFCLFTHFPVLKIDAPWMDSFLSIHNGDELHQILKVHHERCRGVFFGHLHQNLQMFKDGIVYTCVPSNTFQFGGWPTDEHISYNPDGLPAMNLVSIIESQVIVKRLAFSRKSL